MRVPISGCKHFLQPVAFFSEIPCLNTICNLCRENRAPF